MQREEDELETLAREARVAAERLSQQRLHVQRLTEAKHPLLKYSVALLRDLEESEADCRRRLDVLQKERLGRDADGTRPPFAGGR